MIGNALHARRGVTVGLPAVLAVLALAGCGGEGRPDATATSAATQTQPVAATAGEAAHAVAQQYLDGFRNRDGEAACASMSRAQRAMVRQVSGADSCEQVVSAMDGVAARVDSLALVTALIDSARITSVTVDGDVATAGYTAELDGVEQELSFTLVREDGRWVVESPADVTLSKAAAAFDCPFDAAGVSEIVGVRLDELPRLTAACRFGRLRADGRRLDTGHPHVSLDQVHVGELTAAGRDAVASTLNPDQNMIDRPHWGKGAFMVASEDRDGAHGLGWLPAGAIVVGLVVSLPPGPDAERERDRIADEVAAAVRGG